MSDAPFSSSSGTNSLRHKIATLTIDDEGHRNSELQQVLVAGYVALKWALPLQAADETLTAIVAALSPQAQAGETKREPTPQWERRWPHDQPNGWNLDGAKFLALVQANPMLWLALGRAKYLEMRIDTRDGGFNLYDRDGKPLNPDDVVAAAEKARADFGDQGTTAPAQPPLDPCPYAIDGCVLENGSIGPCLCVNPVAQGSSERAASPQEVQEVCAQVADRTALRCVREQIPGDATATFIAKAIRALIPPAASPPATLHADTIAEILKHVRAPNRPASERLDRIEAICTDAMASTPDGSAA